MGSSPSEPPSLRLCLQETLGAPWKLESDDRFLSWGAECRESEARSRVILLQDYY